MPLKQTTQLIRWLKKRGWLLLVLWPLGFAKAENLYRYKNAEGVMVLDYAIPPELAPKGYTILSKTGTVLKVQTPTVTTSTKIYLGLVEGAIGRSGECI